MPRPTSYAAVVSEYQWKERLTLLGELKYFGRFATLEEAIDAVSEGRRENGALFRHQRLLDEGTVEEVRRALRANANLVAAPGTFHELFVLLMRLLLPIRGVGELYVYDAGLRLGAFLGRKPEFVYLHRGSREGAAALGVASELASVAVKDLPAEFAALEPFEIEDPLCIYRDDLWRIARGVRAR